MQKEYLFFPNARIHKQARFRPDGESHTTMSLKILKQQLKDIAIEETPEEPQKEKKRAKEALPEKFTRARKVMKKNTKPKQKPESLDSNVNRIKDGGGSVIWLSIRRAVCEGAKGAEYEVEHGHHQRRVNGGRNGYHESRMCV